MHFPVQIRGTTSCNSHQVPLAFSQFQAKVHLFLQLQQPKERAPLGFGLCKWPVHDHSTAEPPLMVEEAPRSFGTCSSGGVGWWVGVRKESISWWCFGKGKVACTPLRNISHHFKSTIRGQAVPLTHEASSPCPNREC